MHPMRGTTPSDRLDHCSIINEEGVCVQMPVGGAPRHTPLSVDYSSLALADFLSGGDR